MYDYGARFYMPDIGRFGTQDPMQVFDMWQSSYAYANNNPVLYQDEYGLGILNVIGNLFQRTIHFVTNIFNNECRCSQSFPGESIGDAFRRPDFPSNGGGRSRGNSNPSPQNNTPTQSVSAIASNTAGVILPDFSNNFPEINPSAMPSPNILGRNRNPDDIARPPLPTNVEFRRNIEFNQNSTSFYDRALTEKTLYDLISTLQEHAELRLIISGNSTYTQNDNFGVKIDGKDGTVGSLKLGRAGAIKKLLIKKGINPSRILIKKGKEKDYSTSFELK